MKRLIAGWDRYWFGPTPLVNLAASRIVIVAFVLWWCFYVPWATPGALFAEVTQLPDELYDPLPALHLMVWPAGWTFRPGPQLIDGIFWGAAVAGAAALLGLVTNLALLLFAVGAFFLQAYWSSFGDFHHGEAVAMIALGMLALSPAGRVMSLDALVRRFRTGGGGGRLPVVERRSEYAGWPLKLLAWVLALVYLSAAVTKVNPAQGLQWLNGYTLQYYLLQDSLRWNSAIGLWLAGQHELSVVLSWSTILFEGTFFLAVISRRLAPIYIAAGTLMHVGIFVAMRAPFFGFMAIYAVLVPWDELFRRLARPLRRIPLAARS